MRSQIEEYLRGESAEEDRHRRLDLPLLTKIDDEPRFEAIFARRENDTSEGSRLGSHGCKPKFASMENGDNYVACLMD